MAEELVHGRRGRSRHVPFYGWDPEKLVGRLRLCSSGVLETRPTSAALQGPLHLNTHMCAEECQLARLSVSQTEGTVCTKAWRQRELKSGKAAQWAGQWEGGALWREPGPSC